MVVPSAPFTIFNLVGDKSVTVTSPTSGYTARVNGVTDVVQSGDTFSGGGSSWGGWMSGYGEPPTSAGLLAWKLSALDLNPVRLAHLHPCLAEQASRTRTRRLGFGGW